MSFSFHGDAVSYQLLSLAGSISIAFHAIATASTLLYCVGISFAGTPGSDFLHPVNSFFGERLLMAPRRINRATREALVDGCRRDIEVSKT